MLYMPAAHVLVLVAGKGKARFWQRAMKICISEQDDSGIRFDDWIMAV